MIHWKKKSIAPVLLVLSLLLMTFPGFQTAVPAADQPPAAPPLSWHDLRNSRTLPEAIAAIGSAPGTILIQDRQSINTNITIPVNVTLNFLQGGELAIANGATVTMNGPIQAGPFKIFHLGGKGRVIFGAGSVGEAPIEWWGALGDDHTDNVAHLTAAIAAVNETYGNPALILGPGHYRIGGPVTINKNNLTMRGVGHRITKLKCTAAGAGLVLDKGGRNTLYTTRLEEFEVDGRSLARLGIDLVNTSETTFRGVSVRGCLTGMRLRGAVSPSQCTFTECVVADSGTGVKFTNATNPVFDKGNFWNNTTVFDFDTAYAPVFINNWIEKFVTCFLFSHLKSKETGSIVPTVIIRNNYLLSTDGGRTHDCRIFRFLGDNGSNVSNIGPIIFEGNHHHLLSSKFIAEIDWGNLFSTGNRVRMIMKDNHLYEGGNTRAWFKTDVRSESHRSHAHLIFQDNEYPSGVMVQEGAGGFVTGIGSKGRNLGTANQVLGALAYGPVIPFPVNDPAPSVITGNIFKTANTKPTTITKLRDGLEGQKVTVIIADTHTTVGFKGTQMKGHGGKNWRPSRDDWMECLFDGSKWYCSVHAISP